MNLKVVVLTAAYLVITACSQKTETAVSVAEIKPFATLQEFMLSVIDPNIDPIWNAVTTTVTKEGVVEKAPANDEEWAVLRKHAITLIEATNALQLPNRPVAVAGASTSIHSSEEDPKEIERLIRANEADFAKKAQALQTAVKVALVAIDEKNTDGLLQAGEGIEHACESCHSTYWYPNDKRPLSWRSLGEQGTGLYARLRGLNSAG